MTKTPAPDAAVSVEQRASDAIHNLLSFVRLYAGQDETMHLAISEGEWLRHRLATLAPAGGDLGRVSENLRRIRRTSEMSAMRDPRRTGRWEGAEKTARQFDRLAEHAREAEQALAVAPPPPTSEPGADVDGRIERLGEKLFALSDRLRRIGAFDSDTVHAAYEAVVAAYQDAAALSTSTAAGEDRDVVAVSRSTCAHYDDGTSDGESGVFSRCAGTCLFDARNWSPSMSTPPKRCSDCPNAPPLAKGGDAR